MERALTTILVLSLVVCAGCNGVFGGSDRPTQTVTPAAVPTDEPTPTPVPQLAPGLTGEGIGNGNELVAAHRSLLENRNFTVNVSTESVFGNESGTTRSGTTGTIRVGGENGTYRYRSTGNQNGSWGSTNEGRSRYGLWSNSTSRVVRTVYPNGSSEYRRQEFGADETGYEYVYGSLSYALGLYMEDETAVTGRVTRNGTDLYRVRVAPRNDDGQDTTLELLVDSRGLVREYTRVRNESDESATYYYQTTYELASVNETEPPEPPSWLDEVPNGTRTPTVS